MAAVAGAAVAIFAFLKKKGKKIKEELDFDEEMYFDDDEFEDDIMNGDETVAPEEDADEDTAPEESPTQLPMPGNRLTLMLMQCRKTKRNNTLQSRAKLRNEIWFVSEPCFYWSASLLALTVAISTPV